jgi:tartrate-resistant acid phosphatase type 5
VVKQARTFVLFAALASCAFAQKFYTYIGNLNSDSVLIAWGTADGKNTIGRSSPSKGTATIRIDNHVLTSRANWIVVGNLKPDTDYAYSVELNGSTIGQGTVRTWAAHASRLVFFVIGDYGSGGRAEYAIANAMWNEFERRSASDNPVRFVLTVGDNIYGDIRNILFGAWHTGASDSDWASKFFEPQRQLLAHIPFYPTLGNHDGNETERHGDLDAYLDNFFFPGDGPARWYSFRYADLAEFFGLDSTMNTESGPPRPSWLDREPQFQWMSKAIPESKLPWKIPYYHHPVFNAGPRHVASYHDLEHWIRLFSQSGVKVVFNGHEHNFQFSEVNSVSGGVQYVTCGAGGELRATNVESRMSKANIAGWGAENHFLVVEIDGKAMRIAPLGFREMVVRNAAGARIPMPLVVRLP